MDNGEATEGFQLIEFECLCSEEVLPKGCRKPRFRAAVKRQAAKLRKPSEREAPVAFRVHNREGETVVRLFEGKLYRVDDWPLADSYRAERASRYCALCWTPGRIEEAPEPQAVSKFLPDHPTHALAAQIEESIEEFCASRIAFGGMLWRGTPEPCYKVSFDGEVSISWDAGRDCENALNRDAALRLARERSSRPQYDAWRATAERSMASTDIEVEIPEAVLLPSHRDVLAWKAAEDFLDSWRIQAASFEECSLDVPEWLSRAERDAELVCDEIALRLAKRARALSSGDSTEPTFDELNWARLDMRFCCR